MEERPTRDTGMTQWDGSLEKDQCKGHKVLVLTNRHWGNQEYQPCRAVSSMEETCLSRKFHGKGRKQPQLDLRR